MARAEIDRLMDNLRVNLPGALDGAMQLELFNVLDSFLSETGVWTLDDELTLREGETEYQVGSGGATRIVRLLFLADEALTRSIPATMALPGEIILATEPTQDTAAIARVSLSILDPVDRENYPVVPDWITKRYFECIKHGVLAAMMGQLAKPYSNERMSVYHHRKFRNLMSVARADGRKQNLFAGQSWNFPQNFR